VFCSIHRLSICVCECVLQKNNHKIKHKNNTSCGSVLEPGASGLPYYCTSICVRFGCTRRASSVDFKPRKKKLIVISCTVIPPPHPPTPSNTSFFCKHIGPTLCVRFFENLKGAHSMSLLHMHTNHSINTRRNPTLTPLGTVYTKALVVPSSSPDQRLGAFVCGACTGTAQVDVPLVFLSDPLFKQSRLHCLDSC